jgi:hypothetical protein
MATPSLSCQIQWIDSSGNPTPDSNPAIMLVRTKQRVEQHHGRALQFSASQWFPICACHATQLSDPGMHIWECKPLDRACSDPTRNEMLAFLIEQFPDGDEFDREEAIYWFANDYHSGQWSELYSALSTSLFNPGQIANGPEPESMGEMLYQELEAEFGASR